RGNIVINNNRSTNGSINESANGSNGRNGSNRRSTTPQNMPIGTVSVVETSSVSPNNQVIKKLQQENDKLKQRLADCRRLLPRPRQEPRLLESSSLHISHLFKSE